MVVPPNRLLKVLSDSLLAMAVDTIVIMASVVTAIGATCFFIEYFLPFVFSFKVVESEMTQLLMFQACISEDARRDNGFHISEKRSAYFESFILCFSKPGLRVQIHARQFRRLFLGIFFGYN